MATRRPEEENDLDPDDWELFRATARPALDMMVDHLRDVRDRPVRQSAPSSIHARFDRDVPIAGNGLDDAVLDDFAADIFPYANGNLHPLFLGWFHSAGIPAGMIAEMLAAGMNNNCDGRDHIAIDVERQVTRWIAAAFGFPADASGLFVTGASMANFLALLVARNAALGNSVRRKGLPAEGSSLTAYASSQAHSCVTRAMELAGLGSDSLRSIEVNPQGAIQRECLRNAIITDRAMDRKPFLIVGTAGTVNTGAIDYLDGIAEIAEEFGRGSISTARSARLRRFPTC